MSIWDEGGLFDASSPIQDLLKQHGGCKVEDLLEEDQLLQEVRGGIFTPNV